MPQFKTPETTRLYSSVMTDTTPSTRSRNNKFRDQIRQIFTGSGLDLGPWHMPFETPNASTTLCDRYSIEEMREVFAEFSTGSEVPLPKSDVVVNFDSEGLKLFEDGSQDFVIASHLLEHLSQSFMFLAEISRVLKDDGMVLIALPDKRYTFDKFRKSEKLLHYIRELDLGWVPPSQDHIDDYLINVVRKPKNQITESDRSLELARSFHVHVFTDKEFMSLLKDMIAYLNLPFIFLDCCRTNSFKGNHEEFLILLQKTSTKRYKLFAFQYLLKWVFRFNY